MRVYYLYRHIRLDKKIPFYIGIGTKRLKPFYSYKAEYDRAYSKGSRNKYWVNIVSITSYEVEILFESNCRKEIEKKEIEFINLHKNTLVNMTDGGEGTNSLEPWNKGLNMWKDRIHPNLGKKLSKKICERKSIAMKNSDKNLKDKKLPKWWKDKISENTKGKKNSLCGTRGQETPIAR